MRFVFLLLLSSACIFPVSNNGNRRNQDTFTSTSTSTSTGPDCERLTTPDTGKVLFCTANDEISYFCMSAKECWYEAGNVHVTIENCDDQRSIDSAGLELEDVCGGFYIK